MTKIRDNSEKVYRVFLKNHEGEVRVSCNSGRRAVLDGFKKICEQENEEIVEEFEIEAEDSKVEVCVEDVNDSGEIYNYLAWAWTVPNDDAEYLPEELLRVNYEKMS